MTVSRRSIIMYSINVKNAREETITLVDPCSRAPWSWDVKSGSVSHDVFFLRLFFPQLLLCFCNIHRVVAIFSWQKPIYAICESQQGLWNVSSALLQVSFYLLFIHCHTVNRWNIIATHTREAIYLKGQIFAAAKVRKKQVLRHFSMNAIFVLWPVRARRDIPRSWIEEEPSSTRETAGKFHCDLWLEPCGKLER